MIILKTKFSLATPFLWLLRSFLIFCCSKFDEIGIKCFFLDYVICHTADYGISFFRVDDDTGSRRNPLVPRGCVSTQYNHHVVQQRWTWYVFRLFPTNHPTRNHRIYRVFHVLPTVPVHCFQPIKLQFKAVNQSE